MLSNLLIMQNSKSQMDWISQRQKVLSQNIANVDTPEYRAEDIKELRWDRRFPWNSFSFSLAKTSSSHVASYSERQGPFKDQKTNIQIERTISDNNVVLENEVTKMGKSNIDYRLITQLFRKYSKMYDLSLGGGSSN